MEYVVSACLAGKKCRYDGTDSLCSKVKSLVDTGKAISVCPEELGGLLTPRAPCEQKAGRVVSKIGKDYTKSFEKGAQKALAIAKQNNCTKAILKSNSPSCGFGKVHDGTFSGVLIKGNGVFATLLKQQGFSILTEKSAE